MAERRIPYRAVWLLFVVVMITGASLLLSTHAATRAWGLALLLAPLAAFTVLTWIYYVRSRRDARIT